MYDIKKNYVFLILCISVSREICNKNKMQVKVHPKGNHISTCNYYLRQLNIRNVIHNDLYTDNKSIDKKNSRDAELNKGTK